MQQVDRCAPSPPSPAAPRGRRRLVDGAQSRTGTSSGKPSGLHARSCARANIAKHGQCGQQQLHVDGGPGHTARALHHRRLPMLQRRCAFSRSGDHEHDVATVRTGPSSSRPAEYHAHRPRRQPESRSRSQRMAADRGTARVNSRRDGGAKLSAPVDFGVGPAGWCWDRSYRVAVRTPVDQTAALLERVRSLQGASYLVGQRRLRDGMRHAGAGHSRSCGTRSGNRTRAGGRASTKDGDGNFVATFAGASPGITAWGVTPVGKVVSITVLRRCFQRAARIVPPPSIRCPGWFPSPLRRLMVSLCCSHAVRAGSGRVIAAPLEG